MKFSHVLLAGAALLPLAAHAQTADSDVIIVAAGVEQPVEQVGRAVTVIDRAEIEARQTVSISDLLATTAGVGVTRNGGPGALTAVRLRGAEGDQTLVLIDGVRVNDPSSTGAGFDFGNLLASSVERVEVLRGPNSVAWGSQAIGGVVNIVTTPARSGWGARANVEAGTNNQVNANAAIFAGSDSVKTSLTAGYLTTDGISTAAVGTERDGYRQFNTSGRINVEFAPGFGADLRAYYAASRLDLDGFAPPTFAFGDTRDYSTTEETYGYAGLYGNVGPVKNRVSFTIADINRDNFTPPGANPNFFGRGRSERYAYQGDAAIGDYARLVFGAEQEDSRLDDGFTKASQGITSFYGEAILTPVSFASVTLGARNDDHSGFGSHWSYGANAALRPTDSTTLRASYGEGFKAPTLYQRFSAYGTPGLDPETAKSYDVGVTQQLVSWLAVAATWFHRDTRNQIDFISCPAAQVTNTASICYQRPFGTYDNIAHTRAHGVEMEIVAKPVTGLSLRGSYTHTDAENRSVGANNGKDLARRPRDIGSLSGDYRFGFGGSIGGTVLIVGKSFDNAGNSVRLDGYTLVGLRAAVPVSEQVEAYGRVENLTDKKYQTVAGYGNYGRTFNAGFRFRFD